jgi:hypothetical protein
MKSNPVVRLAKAEDIEQFCGKRYPQSMRAVVVELEGEIIGIGGVLHTAPRQAFSEIKDELRRRPKALLKAGKMFRTILDMYDVPVYAIASPKEKNSRGFLEWVGFVPFENNEDLYQWKQ